MQAEENIRDVAAALSRYVGGPLPADLTGTAEAHGLTIGGWVYPSAPEVSPQSPPDLREPGRQLRRAADRAGIVMLMRGDPGWPSGTGADELPCLWVRGDRDVARLLRRAVTVAGVRECTEYGQQVATDLAFDLAASQVTVVCGAAPAAGIDYYAWRAALAHAPQQPVAVAASGLDAESFHGPRELVEHTARRGAVVSAFPPGLPATWSRWSVRDRLLGTFTAATVIVEAAADSRTLDVATAASESGRLVGAVPGPVSSKVSAGCHRLLASGAMTVTGAQDILRALAGPGTAVEATQVFRVYGAASWDDGHWRTRRVPDFAVEATSHREAADLAYEVVFAAHPGAAGATLDAGIVDPAGIYEAVQVASSD
ncbi:MULTISPECIES: DNA-processing protein DprA [Catenuloplanes]|uniref:DNA protecting protein DprA n=1 Tax=Catenuloplanes niger TaxID=587534 RepID=A0AAE3ZPR1_9ACTN|nr:DNA-processing protein DprA [Catenuloplanes niger]MDR7322641.1 DNA protecting protein DprA [Catenuloplanes niger]